MSSSASMASCVPKRDHADSDSDEPLQRSSRFIPHGPWQPSRACIPDVRVHPNRGRYERDEQLTQSSRHDPAVADQPVRAGECDRAEAEPDSPLLRSTRFIPYAAWESKNAGAALHETLERSSRLFPVSAAMLQSELERKAEEPTLPRQSQAAPPGFQTRRAHMASSTGLPAFAAVSGIRQPSWGSDPDRFGTGTRRGTSTVAFQHSDELVSVGTHFVLSLIEAQDHSERIVELCDSPAVTEHGVVVDLVSGAPIFLETLQASCAQNVASKDHARLVRAVRFAHAACEAEWDLAKQEVCAIDVHGVFSGMPSTLDLVESRSASRSKVFHRRRQIRNRAAHCTGFHPAWSFSIREDGQVFLAFEKTCERKRKAKPSCVLPDNEADNSRTLMADRQGVIHVRWPLQYLCSLAPLSFCLVAFVGSAGSRKSH